MVPTMVRFIRGKPMEENVLLWLSGGLALLLAVIHVCAGELKFADREPRSRWLSFASGVSVAYVFVHLLPELQEHQEILAEVPLFGFVEKHVYLLGLLGLVVFYGLERAVQCSQCLHADGPEQISGRMSQDDTTGAGVFWLHISSFMIYNALIGYLMAHWEAPSWEGLLLYAIAMALHFIVNDNALREDHRSAYHNLGRWLLAGSIVMGWTLGLASEISEAALAILLSFLVGSIVLNVIKEELPEQQQSRFGPFVFGAGAYTALLLML
jgi:zinc transporter ZupT